MKRTEDKMIEDLGKIGWVEYRKSCDLTILIQLLLGVFFLKGVDLSYVSCLLSICQVRIVTPRST